MMSAVWRDPAPLRTSSLGGAKARRDLGWRPKHLDPEREIARLP